MKLTTDTKLCFEHISPSLASSRKCLSNIDTYCDCTMESIRSKICQICNFHQICPICVTRGGTWWFKPATHILTWTLGQDVIIRRTIWVCGVSLNDRVKKICNWLQNDSHEGNRVHLVHADIKWVRYLPKAKHWPI